MKKQKIRIILRSNDFQQLDKSVKEIVKVVKKAGSRVIGPVFLPRKTKIFTVLRSPNNDKKSREQFEYTVYTRLLDVEIILNQASKKTEETMNALMKLHLPSSVDVEIK